MAFNSIKEKLQKLNASGVGFMEDRQKGDLPLDVVCTLEEYGFIKNERNEDYVVLSLMEYPEHFFFGGSIITAKIVEMVAVLEKEEKEEMKETGIPVRFTKKTNKKGKRDYFTLEFYPEVSDAEYDKTFDKSQEKF